MIRLQLLICDLSILITDNYINSGEFTPKVFCEVTVSTVNNLELREECLTALYNISKYKLMKC